VCNCNWIGTICNGQNTVSTNQEPRNGRTTRLESSDFSLALLYCTCTLQHYLPYCTGSSYCTTIWKDGQTQTEVVYCGSGVPVDRILSQHPEMKISTMAAGGVMPVRQVATSQHRDCSMHDNNNKNNNDKNNYRYLPPLDISPPP
jgi:hypothetical protein